MRRRLALSLTTFVMLALAGVATTARPAGAQGILDAIKKKTDEAKKAADAVKRKADSTSLAAAKAKASADSARIAAENAKTSVEDAAKAVTSTSNPTATQAGAPARNGGASPAESHAAKRAGQCAVRIALGARRRSATDLSLRGTRRGASGPHRGSGNVVQHQPARTARGSADAQRKPYRHGR